MSTIVAIVKGDSMRLFLDILPRTFVASAFVVAGPAMAAEDILFQDAPAWVESRDMTEVLGREKSADAMFVILDKQVKMEDGSVAIYTDVALRAISVEALPVIGKLIKANWQPDQGDLIIHRLEIIRGDETLRPLDKGLEFEVIRREKNLEQQELNGRLTATTQLEDLQVGDIARFSYSTSRGNPALDGNVEHSTQLLKGRLANWENSFRLIWPKSDDLQWKLSLEDHPVSVTESGGYNVLQMELNRKEAEKEFPKNSPVRFRLRSFLDATSFQSWEDVSAATAKLYQTDGTILSGSDLQLEIDRIAGQTSDPMERTALAIQAVQDKVRYLYNGLGFGNYSPQTPQDTWRLRYGDCKAKTLLLLAFLHKLGIEAEPALVNTTWQDGVMERLPGFQAFNHILVRATIGGKILWLDGTGNGTRFADLLDVPSHRYALPVRTKGAGLEEIEIRPIGRPYDDVKIQYDLSAGTAFPAIYDVQAVLRNSDAYSLKDSEAVLTDDKYREELDKVVNKYALGELVSSSNFTFDDDRGEGLLTARGIAYLTWKTRLGKKRQSLWNVIDNIKLNVDREKPEWKDVPVKVNYPSFFRENARYILPKNVIDGEGEFTLSGKDAMAEQVAGYQVNRETVIEDNVLRFHESFYPAQWEIAAAEIPLEKKRLKAAQKKDIAIVAPKTLMEDWQQVEVAKASGLHLPVIEEFDRLVAHKPDDKDVYQERAYFFQFLGDYDRAVDDLDRSLAIEQDADIHYWRAELLVGNDSVEAVASLDRALALDPIHASANTELVDIYLQKEEPKKARQVIQTARSKGMSDESADGLLALVLQAEGKQDEADALLTKLIEDDPESLSLLNERCWLRGRGDFKLEEAMEDCTEAVELAKSPASYLDSRALIFYRLGMYDDAIADLNRALRLSPSMTSARYLRALNHKAKGDLQAAENDYRAALHLYKYTHQTYDRFGLTYK